MLVIQRQVGQAILIAPDIRVVVLDISGAKVRLGIDAPREVQIDREEWRQKVLDDEPKAR